MEALVQDVSGYGYATPGANSARFAMRNQGFTPGDLLSTPHPTRAGSVACRIDLQWTLRCIRTLHSIDHSPIEPTSSLASWHVGHRSPRSRSGLITPPSEWGFTFRSVHALAARDAMTVTFAIPQNG